MNKRGHPGTLVASHPGNVNALRQGVHSPRLLQARATEIASQLTDSFELSPTQRLAAQEAARCMAILEAIDRDLDERGLEDKAGKASYLLNYRLRVSRQLDHWLGKIADTIERQSAGQPQPAAGRADYVRELERIALGHDPSAHARDRLSALKALLDLDAGATQDVVQISLIAPGSKLGEVIDGHTDDEPLDGPA